MRKDGNHTGDSVLCGETGRKSTRHLTLFPCWEPEGVQPSWQMWGKEPSYSQLLRGCVLLIFLVGMIVSDSLLRGGYFSESIGRGEEDGNVTRRIGKYEW